MKQELVEQFVEFVKDQYGYEVVLEESDTPDTFESIFGITPESIDKFNSIPETYPISVEDMKKLLDKEK